MRPDRRVPHYNNIIMLAVAVLCISMQILYVSMYRCKYYSCVYPTRAAETVGSIHPPHTVKIDTRQTNHAESIRMPPGITHTPSTAQSSVNDTIARQTTQADIRYVPYGASAMQMRSGYIDELILEFENQERSMPADLVYDRDRRPSFPFISGDGFRSLCKHRCEENGCAFSPDDVQKGDCIFIATTNLKSLETTSKFIMDFSKIADRIQNDFVVISHNGDLSVPDGDDWHPNEASFYSDHHSQLLSNPKLRYWFASNCNWNEYPAAQKPTKLICIPIGIENRYNTIGKLPGNYFKLMQKRSQVVPTKRLLVAFTAHVLKPSRGAALAALNAPWITNAHLDRDAWLKAVQDHQFVACPIGHGYDTHRVWEILLMGATPVVQTTPLDSMYKHLPVLIVGKWGDVDEAYLEKAYRQLLKRKDLQIERIFFVFWKNLILNMSYTA
jgi:hypothetical protein